VEEENWSGGVIELLKTHRLWEITVKIVNVLPAFSSSDKADVNMVPCLDLICCLSVERDTHQIVAVVLRLTWYFIRHPSW